MKNNKMNKINNKKRMEKEEKKGEGTHKIKEKTHLLGENKPHKQISYETVKEYIKHLFKDCLENADILKVRIKEGLINVDIKLSSIKYLDLNAQGDKFLYSFSLNSVLDEVTIYFNKDKLLNLIKEGLK